MRGRLPRVVFVLLSVTMLSVVGAIAVAADTYREASSKPVPISGAQATANAMKALPNNGAGFTVVALQLEPSSEHFDAAVPNGRFGEDQVKECLVVPPLPPLPFISPCRYYPVWVVALTNGGCDATVAINAFTGRFGGAGIGFRGSTQPGSPSSGCDLVPGGGDSETRWFQPQWS
jgi:hypothetical protein